MKHVADNLEPHIVCEAADLDALCERIRRAGRFAFDTEFIMEDGYDTLVCLLQLATESEVALVDPLAGLDTRGVWDLVADPAVEVIVHAGAEDLALCYQLTGQVPANVFDVQLANGLVTCDYPISLARLVRAVTRVRLHKSQTLTDWKRRPLTDAQLRYAVEDVAYLPAVRRWLHKRLDTAGRIPWAREEFARFELPATYQPSAQGRMMRVKGAGALDPQRLAIVSELLEVRDQLARKFNRPPRALLRDHLLVEIARHRWTQPDQLRSLRGLHLRSTALADLTEAVKRGLRRPVEQCPVPAPVVEDTPEEVALAGLLTAVLRDLCQKEQIAFALLTTKQGVRELLQSRTRNGPEISPLQRGWRAEATGDVIRRVLDGRTCVGVTGTGSSTHLTLIPRPDEPDHRAGT